MNVVVRRFWPVVVVGLLAGALAFAGSFVMPETYESSTRLLVRGRDTNFLTSTGAPLTQQVGVIDAGLATALSETQTALLSTRVIAEHVVDTLGLDAVPAPEIRSFTEQAKDAISGTYKRVRALLTSGFYAEPDRREAAVATVHAGLSAAQVEDSYVLELRARWDDPVLAALVADTAADALISLSLDRFRTDASDHREYLASQVDRAEAEVIATSEAVRVYKVENGITDLDLQVSLSTADADRLTGQARDLEIQYEGARAQLTSIRSSLRQTRADQASTSTITTGRSTTQIEQVGSSGAHQSLLAEEAQVESLVASLNAQIARLALDLGGLDAATLAEDEAQLLTMQQRRAVAAVAYERVSSDYQDALLTAGLDPVDLSRIDTAGTPLYPIAPVRYLYLGMGGLFGGALGIAMAAWLARRRGERLLPDLGAGAGGLPDAGAVAAGFDINPPANAPVPEPAPAPAPVVDPLPQPVMVAAVAPPGGGRFEIFGADTSGRVTRPLEN